jgi:hypothetical protein
VGPDPVGQPVHSGWSQDFTQIRALSSHDEQGEEEEGEEEQRQPPPQPRGQAKGGRRRGGSQRGHRATPASARPLGGGGGRGYAPSREVERFDADQGFDEVAVGVYGKRESPAVHDGGGGTSPEGYDSHERTAADSVGPDAIEPGTPIEAKWSNGEWYRGAVLRYRNPTGCYEVLFDDGATLEVPPHEVRRLSGGGTAGAGHDGGVGHGSEHTRQPPQPPQPQQTSGQPDRRRRPPPPQPHGRMDDRDARRSISPERQMVAPAHHPPPLDVDSMPVGRALDEHANALEDSMPDVAVPLRPCRICGRKFNPGSLARHEAICQTVSVKKRKAFDSKSARIGGTEAAKFATQADSQPKPSRKSSAQKKQPKWKMQSNQLHEAMKQARLIAKAKRDGVPLSQLPPPPASEFEQQDDRVECPHCGRKFNSAAAERHIPRCQDLGTKPVRGAARGRTRR